MSRRHKPNLLIKCANVWKWFNRNSSNVISICGIIVSVFLSIAGFRLSKSISDQAVTVKGQDSLLRLTQIELVTMTHQYSLLRNEIEILDSILALQIVEQRRIAELNNQAVSTGREKLYSSLAKLNNINLENSSAYIGHKGVLAAELQEIVTAEISNPYLRKNKEITIQCSVIISDIHRLDKFWNEPEPDYLKKLVGDSATKEWGRRYEQQYKIELKLWQQLTDDLVIFRRNLVRYLAGQNKFDSLTQ